MPAIKTGKKTEKYTTEFKVKAVEWSHQAHRSVKSVAEALDIHPFMLSCWRKEHREGEFNAQNRDRFIRTKPGQIYLIGYGSPRRKRAILPRQIRFGRPLRLGVSLLTHHAIGE